MKRTAIKKCKCGGRAVARSARVAEDCEEAWVECTRCGTHSDYMEDAYADTEHAIYRWNQGERFAAAQ